MKELKIKEYKQNILIVTPEFNIEMENLENMTEMRNKILEWIKDKNNPVVIIDLKNCDFIDSTGLGCLIRIFEQLRKKKGKLFACNISENIINLLVLTTLDSLIKCYDSLDEAIKNVSTIKR